MSAPTDPARQNLREAKTRATFIMKDLRSGEPTRVHAALSALADDHPHFRGRSMAEMRRMLEAGRIQRIHALDLVATDWGYRDWKALRSALTGQATVDEALYTQCAHCDHFVDLNDSRAAAEKRGAEWADDLARYVHLEDGEQEFDHDAEPGHEAHTLAAWKERRPDLFVEHPDGAIGPNSAYHDRRGKIDDWTTEGRKAVEALRGRVGEQGGYTPEDLTREIFGPLRDWTGLDLVCIWAEADVDGCSGDSEWAVRVPGEGGPTYYAVPADLRAFVFEGDGPDRERVDVFALRSLGAGDLGPRIEGRPKPAWPPANLARRITAPTEEGARATGRKARVTELMGEAEDSAPFLGQLFQERRTGEPVAKSVVGRTERDALRSLACWVVLEVGPEVLTDEESREIEDRYNEEDYRGVLEFVTVDFGLFSDWSVARI